MRILMVCLGNICRSPLAEGILRKKISGQQLPVIVDSAGTFAGHEGENPDPRAIRVARKYGVDISRLVARPFTVADFDQFDKIFAMDASNLADILAVARHDEDRYKVALILNISHPGQNRSVPDPYYGGDDGFEKVYTMLEEACDAFISSVSSGTK